MGRILSSKAVSFLLVVIFAWLGLSALELNSQKDSIHEEAKNLETKIGNTEKGNSNLEKIISYLRNPSFREKEARLKLNYKTPDENVAFVYRDASAQKTSVSFEELDNMKFYEKWWYWLTGKN